ncbi:ABC transporter ATP-binding protein [Chelativorans sp. AA-79]|uniref:ABC transporter ATP-binding protein n=1 Tax=Chelativorans sp. AA-79 TaxID=3028735 RepID=UPI0023FA064A|nr:ABC transporter ATP-binding protein [Chelativorans sp. AA-79]WEX09650.1 ABC transporter ATP-binding protein [Chelativorans sp. AA-79]
MPMPSNPYLTLDNVTAIYGDTRAVDGVTIEVLKGELVSLLGPSGCGKTTTLRMIAGFVKPHSGMVVLNGRDITRQPVHKRNIGVVFQSYALFPHLTVLDNVGFGLRMRHVPTAKLRERARAVLDTVGLGNLSERYPGQLSGGQQQRVALARALVIEPEVLLLDEPLSNLDAHLRADMRAEIRALQQRLAITTIFVTHDQQEALAIADRIVVMNKGAIAETGRPEQLCDRPASPFTASFLGSRTVIEGVSRDGVFHAPGLTCAGAPEGADRLVLRAARLRVSDEPGPLSLTGTLVSTGYLGDVYEADIESAAGTIRLLLPSDLPPPPVGTACRIQSLSGGTTFIHSHKEHRA